ncbi:helix-turn-helix domain-containing protein [Dietzia maris]|uniref:helix-turn-helix domain-containing protein n=1 Tax=Dietzia maris TaxID=37915 RepID=UPI00223A9BE7|nr:helix-turn-helix domain-containing protein [Dietzia maris]MCT1435094.1 helix-turn-helix domain-containing protein [Dietzia maris]MCT1522724.1 helix-turn-helix domain-containing protein [Dietzia maris]
MHALATENVPVDQLDALEDFARSDAGPELRDLLLDLTRRVRDGDEVITIDADSTLTPNEAAERLGMSRSHLYKLLDRGEILFHRVGRDRRIRVRDLLEFQSRHNRDQRELAERFAHQQKTAASVEDEIADLL